MSRVISRIDIESHLKAGALVVKRVCKGRNVIVYRSIKSQRELESALSRRSAVYLVNRSA